MLFPHEASIPRLCWACAVYRESGVAQERCLLVSFVCCGGGDWRGRGCGGLSRLMGLFGWSFCCACGGVVGWCASGRGLGVCLGLKCWIGRMGLGIRGCCWLGIHFRG